MSVSLNGPDGILPQVQETAIKISKKFGIPTYVLADTTWGTCDLNSNGSKVLGAEIQFNIGHTINTESLEKNLVLIDAFDDVEFDDSSQAYLVQVTVPVKDGGTVIGAITFGIDLDKIE